MPRLPADDVAYRDHSLLTRLAASGGWSQYAVGDVVRTAAASDPESTAVVSGATRLTWRELDIRTDRLAAGLIEHGIAPGERVLLQMATHAQCVVTLVALFKSGIVPVCSVPQYRDFEMDALCRRSGAVAHIVDPFDDLVDLGLRLRRRHAHLRHLLVSAEEHDLPTLASIERDATRDRPEVAPNSFDVMAFQLSGGTTGVPKIIPRFHGEYVAYSAAFAHRIGLTAADRYLWTLPLCHNAGMILVLVPSLLTGATMVLRDRFSPDDFLTTIEVEQVTVAGSIGPIAPRLLETDVSTRDLSSMRYFFTLNRAADLEAHLGVPAANIFGVTEGLLMASHPDDAPQRRHRTVGAPVSPGDHVIVSTEGGVDRPGDELLGELCFSGPSLLTAYVADRDSTATAITADGYFRTGDLVRELVIDGTRCYSFEGRIKENIDRGGEKFGTEEIEQLLASHAAILEARVVGMPDRLLGERVCAFVIPRHGQPCPTVQAVGEFLLAEGLAKFKLPERIEEIDAFPVTSVGKLDRRALRERIATLIVGGADAGGR